MASEIERMIDVLYLYLSQTSGLVKKIAINVIFRPGIALSLEPEPI